MAGVQEAAGGKGAAGRRSCIGPAGGAGGTSHERGEESPSGPPGDGEEFRVGPCRGPWGGQPGARLMDRQRDALQRRGVPRREGSSGKRRGGGGGPGLTSPAGPLWGALALNPAAPPGPGSGLPPAAPPSPYLRLRAGCPREPWHGGRASLGPHAAPHAGTL